jgi:hypothetical protein
MDKFVILNHEEFVMIFVTETTPCSARICAWRSNTIGLLSLMWCRLPIIQLVVRWHVIQSTASVADCPLTLTGVWWKYLKLKKPWFNFANRHVPWTCRWLTKEACIFLCKVWILALIFFPVAPHTSCCTRFGSTWSSSGRWFRRFVGFLGFCALLAEFAAPLLLNDSE